MQEASLKVTYGQNLEEMAEALLSELFAVGSLPFEARLVVVPHTSMKDFLVSYLAHHPRFNIASGLSILPVHQAVMEIVDRCTVKESLKRIPSSLELTLAIQDILLEPGLEGEAKTYLQGSGEAPQGIVSLAEELAKLFTRYGIYGAQFLPSWLGKEGWQQALWKRVFQQWTFPLEFFKQLPPLKFPGKLSLFGFSFLPPVHLSFFASARASCYFFSPCAQFWEDVTSDRERLQWDRLAERKGVSCDVREQLQDYMRQSHPLLGNWGKLGRQMLRGLQSWVLEERDCYRAPAAATLLGHLQRSILGKEEAEPFPKDLSLQMHSAPSRLREVEVMRDGIEELVQRCERQGSPLLPGEILIVATDLSLYAPLIESVCKRGEIPAVVEAQGALDEEVQGLFFFLDCPKQQYALDAMKRLCCCRPFRERARLSLEEVEELFSWFKQARIRFDLEGHPQSWQVGLERLLYGCVQDSKASDTLDPAPLFCVPHADRALLSRFLDLFSSMQREWEALLQPRAISQWVQLLLQWRESFLSPEGSHSFFVELSSWKEGKIFSEKTQWSFEFFYPHLQRLANRHRESSFLFSGNHVLVSSMDRAPFRPARVIWCLGLDEESFPRVESGSSLNALSSSDESGPTQSDQDRFGFLELVMKARDYLCLSYERMDQRDFKEKGPSLLFEELDSYVQSRGCEGGIEKLEHPVFSFDASYFTQEAPIKKRGDFAHAVAKAYYGPKEPPPSCFGEPRLELSRFPLEVTLSQLRKCARHPLQLYCNETLRLFLQEEEDPHRADFLPSPLEKGRWRKEALYRAPSTLLFRLQARGVLPVGGFCKAAVHDLEEDFEKTQEALAQLGVKAQDVLSVSFTDCLEEESSPTRRPLLRLSMTEGEAASVAVRGELEGVTEKGLLFYGSATGADIIKAWPLYLLYLHLYPDRQALLMVKEATVLPLLVAHPREALKAYLRFYARALQHPCPFHPSFAKAFLQQDRAGFEALLMKEGDDLYWNWVKRKGALAELLESFELWQPLIQEWLEPLKEHL